MRNVVVLILCALPVSVLSQITVSFNAGLNKTFISATSQNYSFTETNGDDAWQLGVKTEFDFKKNLSFFGGAYYQTSIFQSSYSACCFIAETDNYTAKFIKIPAGVVYTLNTNKKLKISFSAGGYSLFGVGGTVRKYGEIGDIIYSPFDYTNPIKYGNNSGDDLVKTNWGLELGTTIKYKKIRVEFLYDYGLSNMLTNDLSFGRPSEYKYRNIQLNIGYTIAHFK